MKPEFEEEVKQMEKEFYTVEEVREILNISKYTVYQLINQPDFPKLKIGKSYRIPVKDFYQFIRAYLGKELKL